MILCVCLMQKLTRLTLDLLASPAGSVLSTLRVLLVGTDLTSHVGDPLLAEGCAVLAVGECLGQVTNDTHAGTEQSLGAVGVLEDGLQKAEDRLDVRSQ
jgi:hypothetical protein